MNSQELRALQEAYLDVYEGTHPDIEGQTEFASKVEAILASRKKRREQDTSTQKHGTLRQEYRDAIRRGEEILAARKAENRARGTQKEQVDLYDIILSHLLDEGYADTQEQAEVIMVNMSEDWRESIVEGMKPLPVGKMAKQAERKAFYHNLDYEPWSYYTNTNRQLRTMSEVGGKKVKKAAKKGRELANDVDNRLYRKYAPPDLHR
jgi:hypothetical protein